MEISAGLFARITAVIISTDDAFNDYLDTRYSDADIWVHAKSRLAADRLLESIRKHVIKKFKVDFQWDTLNEYNGGHK